MSFYRSYPSGSGLSGGVPAFAAPIVAVDADWVRANGGRAQRRRIEKELKRQNAKKGKRNG